MNITLRKKVLKDGRESLFLDYYLPKENQKRKKETLKLYLLPNPKTKLDKVNNKKTLELAESIRAKRLLALQHNHYEFSHLINDNSENTQAQLISYCKQDMKSKWHGKSIYYTIKGLINYIEKYQSYKEIALTEITEAWVRGFKEYLLAETIREDKKGLTLNTVNIYYGRLRLILTKAVNEDLIQRSPALHVPNIKMEDTQREFLTLEELKLVIKAPCKNSTLKKAFIFSALTGLRGSDIKKLTWNEIEYTEGRGWYLRFTQKKTKGVETLPIPNQARDLLGEMKGKDETIFNFKTDNSTTGKLRAWLASAGIHKKVTFHCARHTFATLQLTLGTDIYTVSKLLGHKSISTTQIYGKIIDEKKVIAMNIIPDLNL